MVKLSVNVNKVATLRNSRGGDRPRVTDAVRVCLDAGVRGITVHPREDRRHITPEDVTEIAALLAPLRDEVELNIEGDPRAELVSLVRAVRPHQCTLVPVRPGEVTSEAGWPSDTPREALAALIAEMQGQGTRVSLFVAPDEAAIAWAAALGAERVELYTEPFARAFEQGDAAAKESFARFCRAAERAHALGLGVNAGHDLDLDNLVLFRALPHLDEVSIGHALMSDALFDGLGVVVRRYLDVLEAGEGAG
jgi:pyridoxine 5-phosphate synthase